MIKAVDISKNFGPFQAVSKINFEIQQGQIAGLLGPNGAGKTTTLRMLTGYYQPTEGHVEIGGIQVDSDPVGVRKMIGYLPENASLYNDMLVCDYLEFIANSHNLTKNAKASGIDRAVAAASLEKYFYRPIHHLSKGYRQRVGIGATLIHDPKVLILDEPTSGLDPNQIHEIQELIRELSASKTIILSTHILSEVESICERAIIISSGEIILDEPLETLKLISKGNYSIHVTLKGAVQEALDVFSAQFSGDGQSVAPGKPGEDTNLIITSPDHDGERIYHLCVQKGWALKELYAQQESLGDIFHKLTTSDKQEPSRNNNTNEKTNTKETPDATLS